MTPTEIVQIRLAKRLSDHLKNLIRGISGKTFEPVLTFPLPLHIEHVGGKTWHLETVDEIATFCTYQQLEQRFLLSIVNDSNACYAGFTARTAQKALPTLPD